MGCWMGRFVIGNDPVFFYRFRVQELLIQIPRRCSAASQRK